MSLIEVYAFFRIGKNGKPAGAMAGFAHGENRPDPVGSWNAYDLIRAGNWCMIRLFSAGNTIMQDINPITHKIHDLKGRCEALRGYL